MEDGYTLVVFSAHLTDPGMEIGEMIAETAESGRMQILRLFGRTEFEIARRNLKEHPGRITTCENGDIACEVYAVGNFIADLYGRPIPGDVYEFGRVMDERMDR